MFLVFKIICICVSAVSVWMWVQVPLGTRKNFRFLWSTDPSTHQPHNTHAWKQHGCSARAANTLNDQAISPACLLNVVLRIWPSYLLLFCYNLLSFFFICSYLEVLRNFPMVLFCFSSDFQQFCCCISACSSSFARDSSIHNLLIYLHFYASYNNCPLHLDFVSRFLQLYFNL